MRIHRLLLTLVGVFLLLPVTAASGETATQTQTAELNLLQAGVLAIQIEEHVYLGDVLAGQESDQGYFWVSYQNTLGTATEWSATVNSTNFYRYEQDEFGDEVPVMSDTFPYTALTIYPGSNSDWVSQGVTFGTETTFTGSAEPSDDVTMMTAPGSVQGVVSPSEEAMPWLQVTPPTTLPDGTTLLPQGQYRATLTYTITG